jgi:hypothetical protein
MGETTWKRLPEARMENNHLWKQLEQSQVRGTWALVAYTIH